MPVSDSHYIQVAGEIVDVAVPFLLGLNIFAHMRTILDLENDGLSG